uniref:Uncharacterized protein n=1 Tax=Arundo donax TaxID=35708 RepID=A0A0A9G527_ARUDO
MADGSPAGYYVGRPVNHDRQKVPAPLAVDEQVNAQVPGYYAVRVHEKKTNAGDQSSAAPAVPPNRGGFCANCLGCFSGGGTAR